MASSVPSLSTLIQQGIPSCACGRPHQAGLAYLRIGAGAVSALPEALTAAGVTRPFLVFDHNTHRVAWPYLSPILSSAGTPHQAFILPMAHVEPDEHALGAMCMAYDPACDGIVAVGSGVINDCCKVLAHAAGVPSLVVATAPSMDGYASNSSSMIQDRVKVTLYNACPAAILADTDIIRHAPQRMLWAGLGDMLAKYLSICEWRIAHLVTGEYYCEQVAALVRASLQKVVDNAQGLATRDPAAIDAIMEGLILSGIAMAFAQVSRPASGLEHYFSHVWEMMDLDRGNPTELHGIQVGVGTYLTLRLFDQIRAMQPDAQKALSFVKSFDQAGWEAQMRDIFGKAADTIIEKEKTAYHKNAPAGHALRLQRIVDGWPEILRIVDEELPAAETIGVLMRQLGMPATPADIGIASEDVQRAFIGSRDIRDKYLTSSLLWDLGVLHEIQLPE